MKRIGFAIVVVFSLAGCNKETANNETATKPPKGKPAESVPSVEMVSNADLGTRFCLKSADGTTREQIRGLAANKWTAMEAPKGEKVLNTCDIGPILVYPPSEDCPSPTKDILLNFDRIRIEPQATAAGAPPRFQVTVMDPANKALCGKTTPLTFAAHLVEDEHATNKYKWLVSSGPDVYCDDGLSQNSQYQVYVYFVDTPVKPGQAQTEIEKHYRIEFFNSKVDACVKNAGIESPVSQNASCATTPPGHQGDLQEPVGDGRQHRASASGECQYDLIEVGK